MKIAIKLKESSAVDMKAILSTVKGISNIEISEGRTTCTIPREEIAPDGQIDALFDKFGGRDNVKSITITR